MGAYDGDLRGAVQNVSGWGILTEFRNNHVLLHNGDDTDGRAVMGVTANDPELGAVHVLNDDFLLIGDTFDTDLGFVLRGTRGRLSLSNRLVRYLLC